MIEPLPVKTIGLVSTTMIMLNKLGQTIAKIGKDVTGQAPDFVGLAEVENREVVEDLVNSEALKDNYYGIVHYNSPDARGIDVAFYLQTKCIQAYKNLQALFGYKRCSREASLYS